MQNRGVPADRVDRAAGVSALGAMSGNLVLPMLLANDKAADEEERKNIQQELVVERSRPRIDRDQLVTRLDDALVGSEAGSALLNSEEVKKFLDVGFDTNQLKLLRESAGTRRIAAILDEIIKHRNTPP